MTSLHHISFNDAQKWLPGTVGRQTSSAIELSPSKPYSTEAGLLAMHGPAGCRRGIFLLVKCGMCV